MNKKDLPILLLESLNRLNVQLLKIAETNDDLITKNFNVNSLLVFKDIDHRSKFIFEITKIELVSINTPYYTVALTPSSINNNDGGIVELLEAEILERFQTWINWLKVFEKSHLTPEDEFLERYKEEFYTEFEIVDDDADKSPFSQKQQLFLDQYLNNLEVKLFPESETDEEIAEVLQDVIDLRKSLGKDTKKKAIKKFSSILAKLRKSSIKLLGEVYSIAKKEIIKRLLNGGLDEITGLL